MKIEAKQVAAVEQLLAALLEQGNRYILLSERDHFFDPAVANIKVFPAKEDALLAAKRLEIESGKEQQAHPIKAVQDLMMRSRTLAAIADPAEHLYKDLEIGLHIIRINETIREQIYSTHIRHELENQGLVLASVQDLALHIRQDLLSFDIEATKTIYDTTELWQAHIEQDEHRAFHIITCMPEIKCRMAAMYPEAYYDPMEQNIEWSEGEDVILRDEIWQLVTDLEAIAHSGAQGQKRVHDMIERHWQDHEMQDSVDPFDIRPRTTSSIDRLDLVMEQLIENRIALPSAAHLQESFLEALAQGYYQRGTMDPDPSFRRMSPGPEGPLHPVTTDGGATVTPINVLVRFIPLTQTLLIYNENFQPLKYSTMNEKNEEYLSRQMKFLGFGEEMQPKLKEKMAEGQSDFPLFHQSKFGTDHTVATLQFKKSERPEEPDKPALYFLNRYSLMVKNENSADTVKQTFYLGNNDDNITLKEAYNLMMGRSVRKELTTKDGEKYYGWISLNFKETDKDGNFKIKKVGDYDLAAGLVKYGVKELAYEESSKMLTGSLERGNRQSATVGETKIFIEAVPQFKSYNFYDIGHVRLSPEEVKALGNPEKQAEQLKQGAKQEGQQLDDNNEKKSLSRGVSR